MKIVAKSPFNDDQVEIDLFHRDGSLGQIEGPAAYVAANVTVNRVDYRIRHYFEFHDNQWKDMKLTMDRIDGKDAPFPLKAREKVTQAFTELVSKTVTPRMIAEAVQENRQERLEDLAAEIETLKSTLAKKEKDYHDLSIEVIDNMPSLG